MLTSNRLRHAAVGATILGLTACASIGPSPPSDSDAGRQSDEQANPKALRILPRDAFRESKQAVIDKQRILWDRGLYYNRWGQIRYRDGDNCGTLELEAHRGDPSRPENSRLGVAIAAASGYDSVEIDARQIENDRWVLHHDAMTGRATGTFDGDWERVEQMEDDDWRQLRHRDMDTGELLDRRPPTLYEALQAFHSHSPAGQVLDLEVKGDPSDDDLRELDRMVRRVIGSGSFYYSSGSLDTLETLREINKRVYLGMIQSPHPDSVAALRAQAERGTGGDPIYEAHERSIERVVGYGSYWYGALYDDYTGTRALQMLRNKLGTNAGLHLDIRRYAEVPAVRGRAQRAGLRGVTTYSINGPDLHLDRLSALKAKDLLPQRVITDSTRYRFCSRLFAPPKPRRDYEPQTPFGKKLARLPADADLSVDQLKTQAEYLPEGLYVDLERQVRSLPNRSSSQSSDPGSDGNDMSIPEDDDGEAPDLGDDGPVIIDIQE